MPVAPLIDEVGARNLSQPVLIPKAVVPNDIIAEEPKVNNSIRPQVLNAHNDIMTNSFAKKQQYCLDYSPYALTALGTVDEVFPELDIQVELIHVREKEDDVGYSETGCNTRNSNRNRILESILRKVANLSKAVSDIELEIKEIMNIG